MAIDFSNRTTRGLLITAVLLMAAAGGAVGYYLTSQNAGVRVADLAGKTKEDVKSWQQESKLSDDQLILAYSYDETAAVDTVLSQSIPADQVLKKGDVLTVTLSNGPDPDKEFDAQDFTGKDQDTITKWFTDNKFTNVTYSFQASDTVEAGIFISMTPSAGALKRSDAITILLSSGKDSDSAEVTVPDFSAYTRANIQAWGSANKITIAFKTQTSDSIAKDKVISQSAKAGASVKTGTSITVTLSSGKGIAVQSFVGKTRADVQAWLTKNNLKATYTEVYADVDEGQITAQKPSSGTVSEGSSISITVSVGYVQVQNYTGQSQTAFVTYLNALNAEKNGSAKISYSVTKQESDSAAGTILKQALNSAVQSGAAWGAPGSKVEIWVAIGRQVSAESKTGTSEADFKTYLNGLGLGVGSRSEKYSDSVSAGSIISNDTGTFAAGTSISYVVSKGAYSPSESLYAAGASYSALANAINTANGAGAGWSVSKSDVTSTSYDAGAIISCSQSGKAIACQVSSGRVLTVPDVTGKGLDEARALLSGFNVVTVTGSSYDDSTSVNQVTGQSLPAGSAASYGATISLTLSKGPYPRALIPSINVGLYTGLKPSQIEAALNSIYHAAGFYNIQYTELKGDAQNPDNYAGIKSVAPNGSTEAVRPDLTSIAVEIYVAEN